jgi:hypothetical protein
LCAAAEGAVQLKRWAVSSSPSARAACRLDDLVDALVAELERVRKFAKRGAVEMETTHGAVELCA